MKSADFSGTNESKIKIRLWLLISFRWTGVFRQWGICLVRNKTGERG